jgi:hypothetical protein
MQTQQLIALQQQELHMTWGRLQYEDWLSACRSDGHDWRRETCGDLELEGQELGSQPNMVEFGEGNGTSTTMAVKCERREQKGAEKG